MCTHFYGCRITEESEVIEGEIVELEIDRPAAGHVAKMVRTTRHYY